MAKTKVPGENQQPVASH